jgi:cell shape-determining protein MreD
MEFSESIVVPVLLSVVELLKGLGLPSKFAALTAVILGALIGVFYLEPRDIKAGLFKGVVYGLSASGLYSGTKNTVQQLRNVRSR